MTNHPRNYPSLMEQADQLQFLKVAKTFMKKALSRLPGLKPVANMAEIIELADGDIRYFSIA